MQRWYFVFQYIAIEGQRHCATNRPHYGPRVESASDKNEYQEYFLGDNSVGLTNLPPSCADCLEIWDPQGLSRPVMGLLYLL